MDYILERNNVKIKGSGKRSIILAPGFGCDQTVWSEVVRRLEPDYEIILFDYVGMGDSDVNAYDPERYSTLNGYAQDVLDVCDALNLRNVVFIGHSAGGMVGVLASLVKPEYFSSLIMIGPSPCYLNHPPEYYGGFEKEDLINLIAMMEKNYIGWANVFASTVTRNSGRPDVARELEDRFCSTDPLLAKGFAEACFFADNRSELNKVVVPSLIMQCADDVIAPVTVGEYVYENIQSSTIAYMKAKGHCPHMSHPEETVAFIREFLKNNTNTGV